MNRRVFLKSGAATTALFLARPAWGAQAATAGLSDSESLARSKEQIEKQRKGAGTILVRDAQGKPVPGARVSLEQLQHDFLFGANFFQFGRCATPELEAAYRRQFAALLNYCTLGFYWDGYEFERGKPNYAYTDQVVEWARAHGLRCKGHPLVWDHPASSPRWLPEDPKEIEQLSNGRVRELVSRFKGRIDFWDVVNEATHLPDAVHKTTMAKWGQALGPARYVGEPLKVARAANPGATLLVNDYRTDPAYYRILEQHCAEGKPLFDVVGIQSHMHDRLWSLQKVWETCETFSKLGRPLHFTETTIVSGARQGRGENWERTAPAGEARQAEATANLYSTLFAHPAVQAITWWDFTDYQAWQQAPAGWLRQDMSPKPVYERLLALIKGQWWTKTQGQADAEGKFTTRAFYGSYRLSVQPPGAGAAVQPLNREVRWQRGQPNQFEVILS